MQAVIEIKDEHIKLAEKILLPDGKSFDPERVDFIKDLTTHDLHAVPGSGKTTALLAKLIAIEQQLPLGDGSGILVLSHTNVAIDEFKNRIGNYCPRLFAYPNYIGTIQSFIDTFLALPCYRSRYKKSVVRIDDEIYREHHYPDYNLKSYLGNQGDGGKLLYDFRLKEDDELTLKLEGTPFRFKKTTSTYQKILAIKKEIREKGILCFDDAYILAEEYLSKYPAVMDVIRKRFSFAFVDEMQDMFKHQYELLEKLFANVPSLVFQRIGDSNQAIFDGDNIVSSLWKSRNKRNISGSQRLNPEVAGIVEKLAVDPIPVVGHQKNEDGSEIGIMPIMLVFEDASLEKVIENYTDIIQDLVDKKKVNTEKHNIFKAIGWRKEATDPRLCLPKYHNTFTKAINKLVVNYDSLESYLHYYDGDNKSMSSIRKSILNALLRVLRLENITKPDDGRTFTKKTLIAYVERTDNKIYRDLKLEVYQISALVKQNKLADALKKLKEFVDNILRHFSIKVKDSKQFIDSVHKPIASGSVVGPTYENNIFRKGAIEVEVTTVHAVKGQTHTCTLYMETFYEKDVQGKGQHESTRISDQLQGIPLPPNAHDFIVQSLKMAYVGFSRPTHLLCFAVHKTRYESNYKLKPNIDKWDVRFIQSAIPKSEPVVADDKINKINEKA